MKTKSNTRNYLLISVVLLLLDQAIKLLVRIERPVINVKLFTIEYVKNTGASFGILKDNNLMFIWISIIVLGLILINYEKLNEKTIKPVIIITGGIISNLIDRVFLGGVTDYINLGWWPVFNIADSMIVIGIIALIIILEEKDIKKIREKIKKH